MYAGLNGRASDRALMFASSCIIETRLNILILTPFSETEYISDEKRLNQNNILEDMFHTLGLLIYESFNTPIQAEQYKEITKENK